MTVTDTQPAPCRKCGAPTMVLGSGNIMCTACGNIHDPNAPAAHDNVVIAPFGMAPVEEVYPTVPPPEVDTSAPAVLADQVGGIAFLEGGQRATVIEFPDYDHVTVLLADGREETVPVADVDRIVAPTPDRIPGVADDDLDAVPDVLIAEMMLAETIVRAAAYTVREIPEGEPPPEIPQGFMPKGAAMLLVIERAAVSAVRSLFLIYDLDPAAVLAAIDGEPVTPEEGNQQQEETDSEHESGSGPVPDADPEGP